MTWTFNRKTFIGMAATAILMTLSTLPSAAQEGPGGIINPQRDCQTILNCNFTRSGRYRGCVSSYSCRSCSFVPARCSIAGRRGGVCQRLRCDWGA
ncbi:MAG: hypothetical protein ACKVP4_09175 [Hyphomicrobium sp.]